MKRGALDRLGLNSSEKSVMDGHRTRNNQYEYVFRLVRMALLIATVPFMLLGIFLINQQLSFVDAIYGLFFTALLSVLIAIPTLSDITALTRYVNKLSLNKKTQRPHLSVLSNVGELSQALNQLQHFWESQRIELETALIESKLIFDTLPDVIMMLDRHMTIIRTNNAANHLFGSHLYRKNLADVIESKEWLEAASRVVNGYSVHEQQELFLAGDINRHYILSIEEFPIQEHGNIQAIMILHDITESKRNEQLFADFVANASHEIRTPLTSIIGLVETIQTSAKDDPEAQTQFLGIIAEQSQRMSTLVADLLSLSKIERDLHAKPTDIVDVAAIVERCCNEQQWLADKKHIEIKAQLSDALPPVIGDEVQLTQVVTNLLSNAIKYSRELSTVKVAVNLSNMAPILPDEVPGSQPQLLSTEASSAIAISITDQGEGIAQEHLPRLTERFYRVDMSRSQKIKGTGLGLAIVKHILNRHHGQLLIESTVGKGSTFTVLLPVA